MLITVLHPSFKRPELAYKAYCQWLETAVDKTFQYILSLDDRDRTVNEYLELFKDTNALIIQSNGDNVVAATNVAVQHAKGECVIYMSDDFKAPLEWDQKIKLAIIDNGLVGSEYLLQVGDSYQSSRAVLTIPIMSRALYVSLGYFWYPEYRSMFCDNDLYFTCLDRKCLVDLREQIVFEHIHFSNGLVEMDDTYKQSQRNWAQGEAVFRKRARLNKWRYRN